MVATTKSSIQIRSWILKHFILYVGFTFLRHVHLLKALSTERRRARRETLAFGPTWIESLLGELLLSRPPGSKEHVLPPSTNYSRYSSRYSRSLEINNFEPGWGVVWSKSHMLRISRRETPASFVLVTWTRDLVMELNLRVIYPQFEEGVGVQGKLDGAAII
jgi:hypothetical protein